MLRARSVMLVAAVGVAGVVNAGCAEQSAAIRVGDDSVSEKDFLDEVQALGENEPVLQLIVGATRTDVVGELGDDSYTQPFIGYMIQQRVSLILQRQLAENEGIELSDADRDEARRLIEDEFSNSNIEASDLPDGYMDQLVDDIAISQALQGQLQQDEFQTAFIDLAETADVELSSRFGEWNNDAFVAGLTGQGQGQGQQVSAVTPPPGPQTSDGQASDGQASDGQASDGQASDGQASDGQTSDGQGGTDSGSPAG